MRIIRRYKDSGEYKQVKYPRYNMQPVEGLSDNIEYYAVEDNIPAYDSETEYISRTTLDFTEDAHAEYTHIKIAVQDYEVKQRQTEEIIIL